MSWQTLCKIFVVRISNETNYVLNGMQIHIQINIHFESLFMSLLYLNIHFCVNRKMFYKMNIVLYGLHVTRNTT